MSRDVNRINADIAFLRENQRPAGGDALLNYNAAIQRLLSDVTGREISDDGNLNSRATQTALRGFGRVNNGRLETTALDGLLNEAQGLTGSRDRQPTAAPSRAQERASPQSSAQQPAGEILREGGLSTGAPFMVTTPRGRRELIRIVDGNLQVPPDIIIDRGRRADENALTVIRATAQFEALAGRGPREQLANGAIIPARTMMEPAQQAINPQTGQLEYLPNNQPAEMAAGFQLHRPSSANTTRPIVDGEAVVRQSTDSSQTVERRGNTQAVGANRRSSRVEATRAVRDALGSDGRISGLSSLGGDDAAASIGQRLQSAGVSAGQASSASEASALAALGHLMAASTPIAKDSPSLGGGPGAPGSGGGGSAPGGGGPR
jgi:hypothetical protein